MLQARSGAGVTTAERRGSGGRDVAPPRTESVAQVQVPAVLLADRVRLARLERGFEHLLDRRDEVDLEVAAHVVRDVLLDRLLVALGEDQLLDAEAVRGEYLLLDAADG